MPRLVCEHCGYDLSGTRMLNEQYRCPECGKGTKPWARDSFPSWWFGSIGLCVLAQLAVYAANAIYHGSLSLDPRTGNSAAFFGYPMMGAAATGFLWHRSHRMVKRTLIWSIGLSMASLVACVITMIAIGVVCMFTLGR